MRSTDAGETLRPVLRAAPLRLAVLFGSGARGALRPDSDLDVGLLPKDPDWSLADELDLQSRLARAAGRNVDLVRLDRASTLVRWSIAREAIELVAADPSELPRFLASAASEYLDCAPSLERAAELFRQRLAEGARGSP